MNTGVKQKLTFREVMKLISTIISWTLFVLLMICVIFLIYYFLATKVFIYFGSKYEPKFSLYTIISPSMTPNINVYDVIVDVRVDEPEDIEIGDVITFYSDSVELRNGTITHRVISIIKNSNGSYSYQTKGDNNLVEDSSAVSFEKIVGKVVLRIPQLGRVQFFLASNYGWLILIMIPALYIIIKDIRRLVKLKRESSPSSKNRLKGVTTKALSDQKHLQIKKGSKIHESTAYKDIFDSYDEEVNIEDLPKLK